MEDLPRENLRPTPPALYGTPPISICKALIEGFSTNDRKRHPSWANKEEVKDDDGKILKPIHVRLISIGASHYCEKARWALDLVESDPRSPYYYTEDAHPPLFQGLATLEASGGEVSMTPMVIFNKPSSDSDVLGEDILLYDSCKIVKQFCPDLYPSSIESDIAEVEKYIGSHLGATSRCLIYHYMLQPQYYDALANLMTQNTSFIEKYLWSKLLDKGLNKGIRKAMKINDDSAKLSLESIRKVFQKMSEKLIVDNPGNDATLINQTKEYLMDTKDKKYGFTAADLTLAAIGAPLIAPPEIEPFIKGDDDSILPKALVDLKYELRGTLAGQHILAMYKKHRLGCQLSSSSYGSISNGNSTSAAIIPKIVGRNKFPLGALVVTLGATLSIGAVLGKGHFLQSKL